MAPNQENPGEVCETPVAESDMQLQTHVATIGEVGGDLEKLHGVRHVLQAAQHQRQYPSAGNAMISILLAQYSYHCPATRVSERSGERRTQALLMASVPKQPSSRQVRREMERMIKKNRQPT